MGSCRGWGGGGVGWVMKGVGVGHEGGGGGGGVMKGWGGVM